MSRATARAVAEPEAMSGGQGRIGVWLVWLILFWLLVQRLLLAVVQPISIDGSYALAVSRDRSWAYFDHPTLAFWFARISVDIFGTEHVLIARLPYVAMSMVTAWLIYDVTRVLFGSRAGLWALAGYATAPYFAQILGVIILPDTPLNMFLLASARLILPMVGGARSDGDRLSWVLAGIFFGCACLSKYDGFLILGSGGVGLLALREGRAVLGCLGPWIFLLVVAIVFTPVMVWNASNDWASFNFHLGRIFNDCQGYNRYECLDPSSLLGDYVMEDIVPFSAVSAFIGQLLYLLPFVLVVSICCMVRTIVDKDCSFVERYLLWLALPSILFFNILAIVSRIFPHWPMTGFVLMLPLVGLWCARHEDRISVLLRVVVISLGLLSAAVSGVMASYFRFDPLPGVVFLPTLVGWHEVDWVVLRSRIAADPRRPVVLGRNWNEAGYLSYYLGPEVVVGVYSGDGHHFAWFDPPVYGAGDSALAVRVVGRGGGQAAALGMIEELREGFEVTGPAEVIVDIGINAVRSEMVVIPVKARRGANWRLRAEELS